MGLLNGYKCLFTAISFFIYDYCALIGSFLSVHNYFKAMSNEETQEEFEVKEVLPSKLVKTYSATIMGVDATTVHVEVHAAQGLPKTFWSGLPDTAVRESQRGRPQPGPGRPAPSSTDNALAGSAASRPTL